MLMLQVALGLKPEPQVLVSEKSPALVPVIAMLEMVNAVSPLVSVALPSAEVVRRFTGVLFERLDGEILA